MKAIATTACFAALLLAGCKGENAPEQTVQQLMANEVQPTAEIYWNAVQYISDEQGEHDIVPQTDEDWKRVQEAAVKIGALAQQLKTPAYAEGRAEDWTQFSDSLAEVAKQAEQAAAEKNPEKVFEVGGTIYSVCSACHTVYPATTGPEAEAAAAEQTS